MHQENFRGMHGKGERQHVAIHISFHFGEGRVKHVDISSCRPSSKTSNSTWLSWHTSPPSTPQLNSPWPEAYSKRASFHAGEDGKREAEDGTMQQSILDKATQQTSKRPGQGPHYAPSDVLFHLQAALGWSTAPCLYFCPPVMTGMMSQTGQNKSTGPVLGN